ncbi:oligosaccharide flippase family protein [Novosphingobium flavum]|uniref:Oligosaccharide flippase family protein n=1 Tax=Novosphingobium flavum TaxID=1778672 RepID=A0A7X1KLT6_9SPHN|nr:oligosaccharide flippase family protein [Novosphingobium flavum]
MAALAKGGRTNFFGFILRLVARIPFLFIASRLYGASAMGRFASALVMVEFAGMIATLGQKRGLAQRLSEDREHPAHAVTDALVVATAIALVFTALIYAFPASMYPKGNFTQGERLLVLSVWLLAMGDLALAALAYRFDVATTVRARSVIEPWALSLSAGAFYFVAPESGLSLAYLFSTAAATFTALYALVRNYGLPRGWRFQPGHLLALANRNIALAGADAVEWGTRKLDVFILRFFVGEAALGIYYFAQQFASLPQKLKTSFEPVLGPVITRNVNDRNYAAIAKQVCQVGFWITTAQAGIALALAIPGTGLMGLGGPDFVKGTGALVFLLLAEVVAATAVVSEGALVYLARYQNLIVSLFTILLQALLTIGGIELVARLGYGQGWWVAAAAAALMLSLGTASLMKSRLLARILGEPINNWRWPLAWAALPAAAVGFTATYTLPEWAGMVLGIPAILGIYVWIIWRKGFGHEDRMLFRKNVG